MFSASASSLIQAEHSHAAGGLASGDDVAHRARGHVADDHAAEGHSFGDAH